MKMVRLKKISVIFLFTLAFGIDVFAQNQGINNMWLFGYANCGVPPNGSTNFDFNTGVLDIFPTVRGMNIYRTAANISDENGNLLFYTNGYYVADALNDTMLGSSGFNPTNWYQSNPSYNPCLVGLNVPQACLILKEPGFSSRYYLFHNTVDNSPNFNISFYQYVSIIDMNLNNGLGAMVQKNQVILSDSIGMGKLTACKHANGRDWWVICQRVNSNRLFKFLLTPYGLEGPIFQNIGAIRPVATGQTSFSPDGTKYAYYYLSGGLEIMDFDRCSGMFSNPVFISTGHYTNFGGGVAFSPNGHFLYASDLTKLFQYDMWVPNIANSEILIAEWDSFYSPSPPFAALFEMAQLAPDGKIYLSTGNSGFYLHVINEPDNGGNGCDFKQHFVQLPFYQFNGLPNHPNYFLGKIAGSPCDTVLDTGHPPDPLKGEVNIFPNPNNGVFTLSFPVHSTAGEVEVYDVNGKLVHKEYVAAWSQFKRVEILNVPNGIYMCKMRWGKEERSVKVILQE